MYTNIDHNEGILAVKEAFNNVYLTYITKQEHPRGSIVEPQGICQDNFNSLSYNGLKTPIIIAHFLIAKEKKFKLSWSWFEHCSESLV